jgi:hypothetical protein
MVDLNEHQKSIGSVAYEDAKLAAWDFGPVPETGPPDLDTGEEILCLVARLAHLIPMQQARLQMMELPERLRTEQRRWLTTLAAENDQIGVGAAFHQHNLRKHGYGKASTTR